MKRSQRTLVGLAAVVLATIPVGAAGDVIDFFTVITDWGKCN